MPDSGDPGPHLEVTTDLPPGAGWRSRCASIAESVARDRKNRSRAPRGAPACVMGRRSSAIRRSIRSRDGSRGAAYPHQRLSALCSPPSPLRATEGKPGTAKPGYSGLARRSFSEGGQRSVG